MTDVCTFALEALHFASERHTGQTRKGTRREPYINHLIEVAYLVSDAVEGADRVAIAAAALHDTIEDTATTYDDLASVFGAEVADVVAEVTDDKSLDKVDRKRLQVERAQAKSARARLVKMADKISNVRSLAASPPASWPLPRRLQYVSWANSVVGQIRDTSPLLDRAFSAAAYDAVASCGIHGLDVGSIDAYLSSLAGEVKQP